MEPFPDPLYDPMVDPFSEPILDALEQSIESPLIREPDAFLGPDAYLDGVGRMLDALEANIEGTVVGPELGEPEPPVLAPVLSGPTSLGPTSKGPPPPPESTERSWTALQAPVQATPFFTRDGLAPPSYHLRPGGGTGIRNEGASKMTRLCPETNEFVDEEAICQNDCERYRDWGAGFEQCHHDWVEDQENDQDQSDDQHRHVEE